MAKALENVKKLPASRTAKCKPVCFGICATSDPRIDDASRERCVNIVEMADRKSTRLNSSHYS